ncbi:hypothetical protein EIA19_22230 [Escherichia coli]|nr:hypothetical protein EIA19_22230 [Escherichia coli]
MLPSETMIWQPEFTDKTLSRKPGAVQLVTHCKLPCGKIGAGNNFFMSGSVIWLVITEVFFFPCIVSCSNKIFFHRLNLERRYMACDGGITFILNPSPPPRACKGDECTINSIS